MPERTSSNILLKWKEIVSWPYLSMPNGQDNILVLVICETRYSSHHCNALLRYKSSGKCVTISTLRINKRNKWNQNRKGIAGIRNLDSRKSWYLSKFFEQPTAEASKYIKKLSLIKQWVELKHVNQLDNVNITISNSNSNIRHTTLSEGANDLELQLELQNETWAGTSRCGE